MNRCLEIVHGTCRVMLRLTGMKNRGFIFIFNSYGKKNSAFCLKDEMIEKYPRMMSIFF